ncbi:MAG: hypothetical protein HC869_24340 [Rhodospirillales bacterium]|nr:hypothetical protein [Rhodospirillales bacterium]
MKSAPSDPWLAQVYEARGNDELARLYDGWAETYDSDMQGIGYLHPAVIAGLLGRHVPNSNAAILDAGVGTGMLGGILALVGYRNLLGIDMSDGMLARARNLASIAISETACWASRSISSKAASTPLSRPACSPRAMGPHPPGTSSCAL